MIHGLREIPRIFGFRQRTQGLWGRIGSQSPSISVSGSEVSLIRGPLDELGSTALCTLYDLNGNCD